MERAIEWGPRQDQRPLALSGSISLANGHSIPAKVSNVSREGSQVHGAATLPIRETVTLECTAHGVAPATVRWALPGRAGLRFCED
jgi:hypothetical protein